MEGRALPMVFSPSTCPLPLGSAARPRYYGFCWGLVGDCFMLLIADRLFI